MLTKSQAAITRGFLESGDPQKIEQVQDEVMKLAKECLSIDEQNLFTLYGMIRGRAVAVEMALQALTK